MCRHFRGAVGYAHGGNGATGGSLPGLIPLLASVSCLFNVLVYSWSPHVTVSCLHAFNFRLCSVQFLKDGLLQGREHNSLHSPHEASLLIGKLMSEIKYGLGLRSVQKLLGQPC